MPAKKSAAKRRPKKSAHGRKPASWATAARELTRLVNDGAAPWMAADTAAALEQAAALLGRDARVLLAGRSQAAAARELGVGLRTLAGWLAEGWLTGRWLADGGG